MDSSRSKESKRYQMLCLRPALPRSQAQHLVSFIILMLCPRSRHDDADGPEIKAVFVDIFVLATTVVVVSAILFEVLSEIWTSYKDRSDRLTRNYLRRLSESTFRACLIGNCRQSHRSLTSIQQVHSIMYRPTTVACFAKRRALIKYN